MLQANTSPWLPGVPGTAGHCLWLMGLSGAGKSALARSLEQALRAAGQQAFVLDSDALRAGLCQDLDTSPGGRREYLRRLAEVARLMVDAGVLVIVAATSPLDADRRAARELFTPGTFTLVHLNTPLSVCAARDPKGLYQAAREGRAQQLSGLDGPWQAPEDAELVLDTSHCSLLQATARLAAALRQGVGSSGTLC
ncbi:adenylyl-sulfate kinase [Pseudomonas sp. NPDC007930]|uniref:adenylyl-sulfate kinase n=1 Tax=Pseudomonas sp. NPDC007930 TaxID=3364417 RepID=UPI0036EDD8AD